MATIQNSALLQQLSADVREILLQSEKLKHLTPEKLTHSPQPDKWSIAQCLKHMNVYCEYYIPAIEYVLSNTSLRSQATSFRPGWLGNYFTQLMKVDENGNVKKKMKSPANATPTTQPDGQKELEEFIRHQHLFLNLLNICATVDLGKNRVPISISKMIKLKLGDVLMFFVEHEKRHMVQIGRIS